MNKRSRKTKGLSHRLIALLLCCVCLIAAMPISAIALEADATPVVEEIATEKPTKEVIVEPEVTATVAPTPTALSNLEDTSVDGGNSDTALETTTGSTTEPVTESTAEPVTEFTAEPTGETTTPLIPEVMDTADTLENRALQPETGISLAAIGGEDSVTLKIGESATITSNVTGTSADSGHQESRASDNEAVAKVNFTLGDDYKAASATVTGVSAGTATITHTYYTSQAYRTYTDWTTHTETIQVTVSAPEYTVTFSVGDDAAAADVPAPSSATVTGGQTISDLPEPVWKGEDGQFVKVFAGWYSDEALTTEFTSETVVNADTTLHAKWVEPEAEGVYYVNFYSQDGQTVHLTLSAMAGKTVAPPQGPTLVDKVFKGWSATMQEDSPAADLQAFDFNTPISEVANQGANGKTLNLYAWYAQSVTVSFIANGGTAVPSQIIAEGDTATSGQTTREGYTFRGWSTNKDTYMPFEFTTPVNENLTLYAFWDAKLVPVTIVYMYENANDAEYSPAGKSVKVYAPAGSYVSIEKNSITNLNESHAVRYAETMEGALTGYAKTAEANGTNATIPDISDTYYQYETASNKRWVNPDGSTTVLVYYNRARVTLTFAYDQNSTTASIDYTNLISEANRTKYAVSYKQDSNSKFTYSFTAKYGEDITAVWPQVAWVKDSEGNTPSYTSNRQTNTFYAWDRPDGTDQSSNMYTLEADLFIGGNSNTNGLKIVDGKLVGTGTLPDVFKSVKKDWLIYARTTLPGETVDFIYGGKNYTIYKEACQLGYTQAGYFGYKSLNGCTPVNSKLTLLDQYGSSMSIDNLSVNTGSSLKAKFDETFPNQISSGDNCQVLLYDRNNLTLNVWTNDDTHSATDPQNEAYLYGDKIYNEDTDLLKSLETTMTKAGYVFAGWYTTSEFTPGTEYKPDENSSITANMNLYAKWEPNQFRAEYYLYMDDADPYAWQGFAEGGKIDDKLVPSAVQDSFLGWYWYQNGQLVPFDFTSAVGANHVDENGVLKLYAKWSGTTGKVSYLPGIGGDNATQEVIDSRDFAINEASVQLPQYTGVWGSGVPNDPALTFVGWKAPNGAIYQPGRYVLVTRNLMQFEAQWSTDAVKLIYNANGGEGDDVAENWARNSVVSIWDNMDGTTPHFTRDNYTLLGWDENPDATMPTYQLGQGSITLDKDVTTLYAIWKLNTVELTIQKTVSGNMYNANDVFSFTLHYGENPETFTLKGGESRTFRVPVGAEVTVTEDLTKSNGYIPSNGTGTTVTLTATSERDGIFKFTMPEQDGKLVINNDKTVQIDTGISLETVPYILILAVVVIGAVLLIKRRRNRDDD